jgi:hypothetical protein
MTMDQIIREEARLIILKALADQPDGRLNSELLRLTLETFGITKTREWVQAEIRHIEQAGAVTVVAAGTVLVAQLTTRGADHVGRRAYIDGVKRPSHPEV